VTTLKSEFDGEPGGESSDEFYFRGRIPSSKSILNRLLVLRFFEPGLEIIGGDSEADDVMKMKGALAQLKAGEIADCGAAGTTLRFLALLASRYPGTHKLKGSARLFARPQSEITRLLQQLGCKVDWESELLTITGQGWVIPEAGVRIDRAISSQFASALILSAWGLNSPLQVFFEGDFVSEGYFDMTLQLVKRCGMNWELSADKRSLTIPAGEMVNTRKIEAESDLSSAFAIAAFAALSGEALFEAWPESSLQPDRVFADILREMGCGVEHNSSSKIFKIQKPSSGRLKAITKDLRDCPDLFPVLAILCGFAEGSSTLFGAPHLVHKESSRIEKSLELLRLIGVQARAIEGGLEIQGREATMNEKPFEFDPADDHRLAMAAAVARAAGASPQILHPEVVNKSFPEFWSIIRGTRGAP
jgi:3-phosphoshikimate 1-carboxyvinyltransferase